MMRIGRAVWIGIVAGICVTAAAAQQGRGPRVVLSSGALQGVSVATLPRGGAFLGVPFAAQPVGDLRWRAPQAVVKWAGVREASVPGPACPQFPSEWLPEMLGVQAMKTDEACLTLSVWTPELRGKAKLPVFVWIHGGGNVEGAENWPPLGETLARRGVVVVSIHYRLGVLGFLASDALRAESAEHVSGNYGLLDQVAALRWVRKNIAAFGGDAGRVTIGGQSSGSLDVCNLMASPLADGLFEGAVLQSGVCVDSVFPSEPADENGGALLAKDLGLPAVDLKAMRAMPAERILQAARVGHNIDQEPVIDGWVLPQQPAVSFAHGNVAKVRVLVGSNDNEISIFASPIVGGRGGRPSTVAAYRQWLQNRFKNLADEVFAAYPAATDGDAKRAFEQMDTDFDFGFGAWLLANDMAREGQAVYLYHFDYVGSGEFAPLGAFHSEESMFLSKKYWTSWTARPEDAMLSDAIVGYWAAFIKTGNPNAKGLPEWPEWHADGECQRLDRKITSSPCPRVERFGVFQEYLTGRLEKLPR